MLKSATIPEAIKEIQKRKQTLSPNNTGKPVNKLIIQNDTEDEEELRREIEDTVSPPAKTKRNSIEFNIEEPNQKRVRRESSRCKDKLTVHTPAAGKLTESDACNEKIETSDVHRIRTSKTSSSKYENLPSRKRSINSVKLSCTHNNSILLLNYHPVSSAIAVTSSEAKFEKKERCKFYPSCGKGDRCEFVHPSTPCKTFPNCKFGDQCLYLHPKCKFDLTCSRLGCSFTHTIITSAAPPICKKNHNKYYIN